MIIGYARVLNRDQAIGEQIAALRAAGCDEISYDVAHGSKSERPELQKVLAKLSAGDTIIVSKLDVLGRNIIHLIETIRFFNRKKISIKSLTDSFHLTSDSKEQIKIFDILADFIHDNINERTINSRLSAKARGREGGRPASLSEKQITMLKKLYADQTHTVSDLCELFKIGRTTLYKYVK